MQAKIWSMTCHLSSLLGYATGLIGNIVGPLMVWILKKDDHPEVDQHGKESLNFNLSVLLYGVLFVIPSILTFFIAGFVLYPALILFHVICSILAAVKASQGQSYRYPLCIRFIS